MTPKERVEHAQSALKVFPLPSVVLFPGTVQPLHIFEPRYRELLKDALATDGVMALTQLEPTFEEGDASRPRLVPTCCAGIILWHEELEDGRFNIVLQGITRARIDTERPPTRLYREVHATVMPDPPYQGPKEEQLRQGLFELAARLPDHVAQSLLQAVSRARGGALADVVAGAVVAEVERRQALLEELDVDRRLDEVLMDVGELIARLVPVKFGKLLN